MNQQIPIPRIRGNAVQLPNNRWGYEMEMLIGESPEVMRIGSKEEFEGFESKEDAIFEMKKIAKDILEKACEVMGVQKTGYYDLTKNSFFKDL